MIALGGEEVAARRSRSGSLRPLLALLAASLACLTPVSAGAQLALAGVAVSSSPPAGTVTVRWPDVAHDPDDDVFLAVSGAGRVGGLLLDGTGAPRGEPFVVDAASAYAQAPRVAYAGEGAFFVAWHESVGDETMIRARLLAHDGAPRTGDLDVSPPGTNWEMGAALARSPASGVLLVAWQRPADTRIVAQRVSSTGALRGGPIEVDPRAYYFRDPAVAHHAASDAFVLAYAGCVADRDCFVAAQRIAAGSGERLGEPIMLEEHLEAGYVPELAYVEHRARVLAVWHFRSAGAAGFRARAIDAEGGLSPTVEVTRLGSYDANGLAYSPHSGTVLFVSHGADASDVAIELDESGTPLGAPLSFGVAESTGNFNPRVAASARGARWVAVTSTEFRVLTSQAIETSARLPAEDAGAGGADAGVPPGGLDAASVDDASRLGDGRDAGGRASAGGCACRTTRAGQPGAHALTALCFALTLAARSARCQAARAPQASPQR